MTDKIEISSWHYEDDDTIDSGESLIINGKVVIDDLYLDEERNIRAILDYYNINYTIEINDVNESRNINNE